MIRPTTTTLLRSALAGVCVALASCSAPEADEPSLSVSERAPKLLLIGIDGVRIDVLAEAQTPSLDALAEDGFLIDDARTTQPSVSGPAWSSMLLGVWPDKHGVLDNEFGGQRYAEYPDFLTRLEAVRPELETVAIGDWLPLFRSDEGSPTVSEAIDVKHALDGYTLGWPEADARVAALAAELLREADPDALFVYLGNPDETSHEHGSIGDAYRAALALADLHVAQVLSALRDRPTYEEENWLVLVSTDHGRRSDGGHGGDSEEEMRIFILASGTGAAGAPRSTPASIVDLAPTALEHLGVEIRPEWGLDGTSLISR